jgi:hypothetical protein
MNDIEHKIGNDIYSIYNDFLKIKKIDNKTNYPFDILNNELIDTIKNEIEISYIDNYKTGGNINNTILVFEF